MTTPKYDANSLVLNNQLNHVLTVRAQQYRPAFFRQILNVSHDVPSWAEYLEVDTITDFAEFKPINSYQTSFPTPTEEKDVSKIKIAGFGAAYSVTDDDLDRAEQTKVNVSASRPLANQRRSEQILESIAAIGYAPLKLLGLLNQDADLYTLKTKTGGGVAWSAASLAAELLDDLEGILYQGYVNSKQLYTLDTIVLPVEQYAIAGKKRNSTTGRSVLQDFTEGHPGVRIFPWQPCKTAGDASVTRMAAFDSKAPEVATMYIPQELRDSAPVRGHTGFSVAQIFKTAGVLSQVVEGIVYADGV
jgi:hypothetical protein